LRSQPVQIVRVRAKPLKSDLGDEEIKSIVKEKFKPTPCPKCGKSLWELEYIPMPSRTMKMRNLRIIRCAACKYTTEW
jgi:predicted nucleic-acid-binding Zn-ribbon protein